MVRTNTVVKECCLLSIFEQVICRCLILVLKTGWFVLLLPSSLDTKFLLNIEPNRTFGIDAAKRAAVS